MFKDRSPSAHRVRRASQLFLQFIPITLTSLFVAASVSFAGPFLDAGHAPSSMVAWATEVDEIIRGPIDIENPGGSLASFGTGDDALGEATGVHTDVVSLGDGGSAVLYFESGIGNGPDDDFAIFENGFAQLDGLFAELAYVEVSSDGLAYARFDSDALNAFPIGSFDTLDPTDYHGLAGRHPGGIGTGFDLADLSMDPLVTSGDLDLYDVQYVRVIDVIGNGSTVDGAGNPIYDPYNTPFDAGGFDLEAIGAIYVPEPMTARGLMIGLLGLSLGARRSARGARSRIARTPFLIPVLLIAFTNPAMALTATFEDLGLGAESFENGSGLSGGYTSGGIYFENNYFSDFGGYFDGFVASTTTDTMTPGYLNQYSTIVGAGAGGSEAFGIFYNSSASIVLPTPTVVSGAEFTNTTYSALSMLNGDGVAKAFGGISGDDEDFFRVLIEGIDDQGASTGVVELMLADYRFADNSQDYILDEWVFLDLMGLGVVSELRFAFESSDLGQYGINTPQYFAIDNLVTIPEPGTALLMGFGLAGLARRQRSSNRTQR